MTHIGFLHFLLLLLLHQVYSQEIEPVFRAKGTAFEIGYCFGVDYIAVYRSASVGDQLLGNSSADATPTTVPPDLQGRIHIKNNEQLLGLQITHLTHTDSGVYRRECWEDQTLVKQHSQRLSVCDEEVESEEIIVKENDGHTELLCNSTSIGLEGTSVLWYLEKYPFYNMTLFVDSSASLDPLLEELQDDVEVRDHGAMLRLDSSILKTDHHFYCLVFRGENCLSFQYMYLPQDKSRDIFASHGDEVVLNCPADGNNQYWETPQGRMDGNSVKNSQIYISNGYKSEDFSLIITKVGDEYVGDYSCVSSSFEIPYVLILCPKMQYQEMIAFEGDNVMLDCDGGDEDLQRVQWHRQGLSALYGELILDSQDSRVPIPQDLSGRLTVSENGSMKISHLDVEDQGVFWCVALGRQLLEENDSAYEDDYDDDFTGDDESSDESSWFPEHKCTYKQQSILKVIKKSRTNVGLKPETTNAETPADRPAATNVTTYAVVAVLLCLLVLAAIAVVVIIKKKAKTRTKRNATENRNTENADPDCNESLM
ncbi:uncharacterized protein V6R79_008525 [Siganus canaliculatus]